MCEKNNIDFTQHNDYFLNEPEEIEQRKVFSPYFKLWQKKLLEKEITLKSPGSISQIHNSFDIQSFLDEKIVGERHPYFSIAF